MKISTKIIRYKATEIFKMNRKLITLHILREFYNIIEFMLGMEG